MTFFFVLSATPEGRMFGLDAQTLIQVGSQLFNVGLLAFIMTKLLYKPVQGMMRKRAERIQHQLDQAADEKAWANELKVQYEQKLKEIERERDGILDEARKRSAENSRLLLEEAKREANAIRERAQATVEMEWTRAQAEMKLAIINISAAMAEKFVMSAMDKSVHDKLFDETMAELGEMAWRS